MRNPLEYYTPEVVFPDATFAVSPLAPVDGFPACHALLVQLSGPDDPNPRPLYATVPGEVMRMGPVAFIDSGLDRLAATIAAYRAHEEDEEDYPQAITVTRIVDVDEGPCFSVNLLWGDTGELTPLRVKKNEKCGPLLFRPQAARLLAAELLAAVADVPVDESPDGA